MQAIAERTKLPEQEVELLLMKSLSLGLVKGIISGLERCHLCVCMYVCVFVYVCVCVCMCACMCACMYVCQGHHFRT
jgi:hypothetical protein